MTTENTAAVVLAAGKGTRMKSARPKVMHAIAGRPMVRHVLSALEPLGLARVVVVVGPDMPELEKTVAPHPTVVQRARRGTADAVSAARPALNDFDSGTVLIVYGDTPLVRTGTIERLLRARESGAALVILGFRPDDPAGYGRLVTNGCDALAAIVEHRDATPEQREIDLCNSGMMAVDAALLFALLDRVGNDNARGEFYLTDIVGLAREDGLSCRYVEADAEEMMGVDNKPALARAEAAWQARRRRRALEDGATLIDPDTVWFSHDTVLGSDVVLGQNVVFGPGVTIGNGVEIGAFSHISEATVGGDARVGPFARLRPGADIGKGAHVGNFVEVKNAVLGEGAKVNHLSYIGDSEVGAGANIGAGAITCNYDGYNKHRTVIGKSVFIGSNAALVAPVTIGDDAFVAAGSTVVSDVEPDALAIARGRQADFPKRAAELREKLERRKRDKMKGDS